MRIATTYLKSVSPYSQGRYHNTPKKEKEGADDYERRTWRGRLHVNSDGFVFIPPLALKNCIAEAAKFLSVQIAGKGKSTYTKHFEAGVLVMDPLVLSVKAEDVAGQERFVPADGRRGGPKRVMKVFPVIPEWEGEVTWHILDETITPKVFEEHLVQAGKFIGLGLGRVRNNGIWGRFDVVKCVVK